MPGHLVELARVRVADGVLPASCPDKTLGGISKGAMCPVCRREIPKGSLEIEAFRSGAAGAAKPFLMHPACYAAWSTAVWGNSRSDIGYRRWCDPAHGAM
jgi:hypothetical protein